MPLRQAEGQPVLTQVVADRDLSAERIPTPLYVQLIQVVGVGLHQDRHGEARQPQRISDALLVAEVRQADEDAVDAVAVAAEELGTRHGVLPGFYGAELGVVLSEKDDVELERRAERQDVAARLGDERVGKEIAIADDDCERTLGHLPLLSKLQLTTRLTTE